MSKLQRLYNRATRTFPCIAKCNLKVIVPFAVGLVLLCAVGVYLLLTPNEVVYATSDSTAETANIEASECLDETEAEPLLYIHVCGAVVNEGVYELASGSRVCDAVQAAGGFTDTAQTSALNLARVLEDGEQIYIPNLDEQGASDASVSASSSTGSSSSQSTSLININTATAEQLESLPGIGESTAQKIISYRNDHGSFASTEDLKNVSGIGDKKYEALAGLICV